MAYKAMKKHNRRTELEIFAQDLDDVTDLIFAGYSLDNAIKEICVHNDRFQFYLQENEYAMEQIKEAVIRRDSELLVLARKRIKEALEGKYGDGIAIGTALEVKKMKHDRMNRKLEIEVLGFADKVKEIEIAKQQMEVLKGVPVIPLSNIPKETSNNDVPAN